MLLPCSSSATLSIFAMTLRVCSLSMAPEGLFGELMITAATPCSTAFSKAAINGCISSPAGGTTISSAPAFSANTLYSGKNGARTATFSPSLTSADMTIDSDEAAPQVR